MKIKQLTLNIILFFLGAFTLFYLYLGNKNQYAWTYFAEGFGALFIIFPLTIISGVSCLIHSLVGIFRKGDKVERKSMIHIGLAVAWLIFLHSYAMYFEFQWRKNPEGVILDQKTKLGEILPDTKWVELNQRIFFTSTETKDYPRILCSIDTNGNNYKKIMDNVQSFGWIPNSQDMFVYSDGVLYRIQESGEIKEKIYSFGYYREGAYTLTGYKEGGGDKLFTSANSLRWSPDGSKFLFAERDKDTDGNGYIEWRDNPSVYIFDIKTKNIERVNLQEGLRSNDISTWDKNGNIVYIQCWKAISPNDVGYYILSYNLKSKEIKELVESKEREPLISKYFKEENLFSCPPVYYKKCSIQDRNNRSKIKENDSSNKEVAVFTGQDRDGYSIYIKKGDQLPKKIFEEKNKAQNYGFCWLPGERYVIFTIRRDMCILDTKTERIGILTKGVGPVWREMNQ